MRLSLLARAAATALAVAGSLLSLAAAQPAPFSPLTTAPSLLWSASNVASSSHGAWSRDGLVWFSLDPEDLVTLRAIDLTSGAQNWAVDLSTYTTGDTAVAAQTQKGARASARKQQQLRGASLQGRPTDFSCLPQLALSDDGALLYILCSLDGVVLMSVSAASGAKFFSTLFSTSPLDFGPRPQLLWVQPSNNPSPILLTVDANCALYGLNSATGALRWSLGLFHTDDTRCALFVRDAHNSTGLFNRLINDGNPSDQNQVLLSMSYPTAEEEAAAVGGVVRRQQQAPQRQLSAGQGKGNVFSVVRAVSSFNPRMANPSAVGPARLFVLGSPQGSDLRSYTLEILETDDRSVATASFNASALAPALVDSMIAAESTGRHDGVQQNVAGNLLLPAMLFESALPITSLPSGLLAKSYPISFPISRETGGAALIFEPLHARVLLASEAILAAFDASLPETAELRYIWSGSRYIHSAMGVFPLQSEFSADVGTGEAPAPADLTRRVRWIEGGGLSGGGAVMLTGLDSSDAPFASVFISAAVDASLQCSVSSAFNASCTACQLESINLTPLSCGWCNATRSCVQMFQQPCGSVSPLSDPVYLTEPSRECSASYPESEHHEWYEQPAFWIVFAIFSAIVLAVVGAHVVAQRRAKHAAEVDGYMAAH